MTPKINKKERSFLHSLGNTTAKMGATYKIYHFWVIKNKKTPETLLTRLLTSSGSPMNCTFGELGLIIIVLAIENSGKVKLFFWGGMVCPLGVACHISYVILTDIMLKVLETLQCFLSKSTNYMHILASAPE